MISFNNDWDTYLCEEFKKEYYLSLREFLKSEYSGRTVYPPMNDIYNALRYTSLSDTRVVILGQDPYHGPGQAHGLCFSVKAGVQMPPSLKNIFKELHEEYGMPLPETGELTGWARQGVLLLNTTLTVRAGAPLSHKGHGWEQLTDRIIEIINAKAEPVVFMLWGGNARSKKSLITNPRHLVLECAHPSPLSAYNGFFGCNHFKKANEFLAKNNLTQINWTITN